MKVDEKGRDIDDHAVNGADDQVASIVLVTNSGLQELRNQLDAVRNQVGEFFFSIFTLNLNLEWRIVKITNKFKKNGLKKSFFAFLMATI